MARWIAVAMLGVCLNAGATSYYVSNAGADGNSGTSAATAWRTLAKVNAQMLSAGDTVYLQRGGIWMEPLIPLSSGTSGNPIKFDAYGSGAAPIITAATPMPFIDDGSWTHVDGGSGNTWKAAIPSTLGTGTVNMVQFGKVYGRKQPYGTGCQYSIVSKYDWCVVWPNLYVYSPSGTKPVITYASDGGIVPIVSSASGLQMIYVNGKSWLTFQHIRVQGFDYVGVGVAGSSDHLVFANMESAGTVPYGTTPLGFYVNALPAPGDIQFLNDDAHLNYDGFKIDGAAVAIVLVNCRGYANRDAGLKDNTGGHVTYSYSHFYGNNIAQFPTSDVVGAIEGLGNVATGVAPVVTNFTTYPARFSFTVDDVGSSTGTEEYVNSLLPIFSSRGLKFNAAVVPSYAVDWESVNNWYEVGHEIDSHSWSHQYYTTNTNPQAATPYPNAPALDLRYTGNGTAATVTIVGDVLATSVTGSAADNLNVNLAAPPFNTISALQSYLAELPSYTVSYDSSGPVVRGNGHSVNLLNVANLDIKNSTAVLVYDQTKLVPDEMLSSKAAIENNVSGSSIGFYVYPDGIEDPTTEADAIAAGYTAARGSLAMKGQDNVTASASSVYANGVNVQNITSLGAIQIHGLAASEIDRMAANLVFRASVWGVPYGFFTHFNSRGDDAADVTNGEVGEFLDSITAYGGRLLTNTELARTITSGANFSGGTRWIQNPSADIADLGVATAGSATVGAGTVTQYPIDINGRDRTALKSWDIGAGTYISQRYGSGGGGGQWVMR